MYRISRRRFQTMVNRQDLAVMLIISVVAFTLLQISHNIRHITSQESIKNSLVIQPNIHGKIAETEISQNYISKALRRIQYGADQNCEPAFNILYLKTHKCASSTMQNILFRYACTHNQRHESISCGQPSNNKRKEGQRQKTSLVADETSGNGTKQFNPIDLAGSTEDDPIIVAVPSQGVYAGHPERFKAEMFQHPKWLLPPSGLVNLFGLHSRLDPYQLQRILHPYSMWVTVLRNPVHLYTSLFTYFKLDSSVGASLEDFLKEPLRKMKGTTRLTGRFGANQMTFDLGYDPDVFYADDKIDDMIADLDETFDLVLIAERMDESLILLGHALCWSLDDLVSLSKNVLSQRPSLTTEEESKLEELNYSDTRLYEHFSRQFEEITELYGKDKLQEEVKALKAKREEVEGYCVKEVVKGHNPDVSIREYSGDVLGFQLSRPEDPLCKALAWNSKQYIDHFRELLRRRFKRSSGKEV